MQLSSIHEALKARLAFQTNMSPFTHPSDAIFFQPDGLPDWWQENNNILYSSVPDISDLNIVPHPGLAPPTNATVVLRSAVLPHQVMLWGNAPIVYLGQDTRFPAGSFCCGDASTIAINDRTSSSWAGTVDSRNGGIVYVGADGLWAGSVQINSDDMHAIRDLQGNRLNPFGGVVIVGDKVWLGYQSLLLCGTHIGSGSVIGARSLTRGSLPANTVSAGSPARVIRSNIQWQFEDLP